jgi:hypothetical protein
MAPEKRSSKKIDPEQPGRTSTDRKDAPATTRKTGRKTAVRRNPGG